MAKSVFTISDGSKVTSESTEEKERRETGGFAVKDFINQIEDDLRNDRLKLPTMPTVAIEALMVINDCNSSANNLVKVVSKDTSLTARLIRYANSPLYYGRTYKVTTIKQAVTGIGFQKVKNAIYSVSMREVFKTSKVSIQRRMDDLWEHSVKVGAYAVAQARSQPDLDPDVALVAGLIHDIGKIPLLIKACDHEVLVKNEEYLDRLLEKLHTGLGKAILKSWEFDPSLVEVAAEHEDLGRQPQDDRPDYVDLIQVANIMAYEGTQHPLAQVDRSQVRAFQRLGIVTGADENAEVAADAGGVEEMLF
ncbi:MAG: HDOD domain-containing protein [Gammaproteobacteria bacterium]|nr:HDOD domain-containing protein [Gammaproteobacteria bacterium]